MKSDRTIYYYYTEIHRCLLKAKVGCRKSSSRLSQLIDDYETSCAVIKSDTGLNKLVSKAKYDLNKTKIKKVL